jgi:UDP-glucose 4-epimerase
MKILIIGGAGYIGSHTALLLLKEGYEIGIFDSLEKGHKEAVEILKEVGENNFPFFQGNLLNFEDIDHAIGEFHPDAIIHFAAYIEVGESVQNPIKYYENNVYGGINLLKAMRNHSVDKIVFSSTAAIFGQPEKMPISEDTIKNPINPYGKSKLVFENILEDSSKAYGLKYVALRYFNACGAEENGVIGEDHEPESHLIPLVMDAANGKRESVSIYGTDYDTKDGTCIRDYIHILDLADAHIKALEFMVKHDKSDVFNLGNGAGYTVKEIIDEVKKVSGKEFKVIETQRRLGDPVALIADSTKAQKLLEWKPKYNLKDIVESAWKWETTKGRFEY